MSGFKDDSRKSWTSGGSVEHINAGSLQRIADAVETMAASYDTMRRDRDYWKAEAERRGRRSDTLRRSNAALRGIIKKWRPK